MPLVSNNDAMAAPYSSPSSLPQGFSVYKPARGAWLQFFPALGTQQLDDLIHAYVPGSGCISEKRATVAIDFCEHTKGTGQTFKFYAVDTTASLVEPSVTNSPSLDSTCSSFNVSPATSTWNWSTATSVSSRSSARSRRPARADSSKERHQTIDFSNLPGMKILTRDGLDVTNSASRGSKTKEQRDHAHLMRIIKACDSCRRKKTRCDPSHKKQTPVLTQHAATASSSSNNQMKTLPQEQSLLPQSCPLQSPQSQIQSPLRENTEGVVDDSSAFPQSLPHDTGQDFPAEPWTATNTDIALDDWLQPPPNTESACTYFRRFALKIWKARVLVRTLTWTPGLARMTGYKAHKIWNILCGPTPLTPYLGKLV